MSAVVRFNYSETEKKCGLLYARVFVLDPASSDSVCVFLQAQVFDPGKPIGLQSVHVANDS
jgi:hypothetical protein